MFDVGLFEMAVIAIVALIVLGPERLPKAARFAGLWVRKARAQWYSVKSEFEREMAADELRRSLAAQAQEVRRDLDTVRAEVAGAGQQAAEAGKAIAADAALPPVGGEAPAAPASDATDEPPAEPR